MTSKPLVVLGAASLLTLAAGFSMGRITHTTSGSEKSDPTTLSQIQDLQLRLEESTEQLVTTEKQRAELLQRNQELNAETLALKNSLAAYKNGTAFAGLSPGGSETGLSVAFGELALLAEFRNADWSTMAEAVENIHAILLARAEREKKGLPPLPSDWEKIRDQTDQLARLALPMLGKVPTHGRVGEGAITHPLMQANFMASMLERADLPLSENQKSRISKPTIGLNTPRFQASRTHGKSAAAFSDLSTGSTTSRSPTRSGSGTGSGFRSVWATGGLDCTTIPIG